MKQDVHTLVDYANRYPEAVPLKTITTEAVAEALLDIYRRVGIPEELLTYQGTQFISECMQEVSTLLSIKGLPSTTYHPISNRLVQKWNRTSKSMLKSLSKPAEEVTQTDQPCFVLTPSPFQLLHGRSFRGPETMPERSRRPSTDIDPDRQ